MLRGTDYETQTIFLVIWYVLDCPNGSYNVNFNRITQTTFEKSRDDSPFHLQKSLSPERLRSFIGLATETRLWHGKFGNRFCGVHQKHREYPFLFDWQEVSNQTSCFCFIKNVYGIRNPNRVFDFEMKFVFSSTRCVGNEIQQFEREDVVIVYSTTSTCNESCAENNWRRLNLANEHARVKRNEIFLTKKRILWKHCS